MGKIKEVSIEDPPLIHGAIRSLMADRQDMELLAEGYMGDHVFSLVEQYRPDVLIWDLMMLAYENSHW